MNCPQVAELLDGCAALRWNGYQHALSHGERERAEVLEQKARELEGLADEVRAYAWQPEVTVAPLSPAERDELDLIFVDLVDATRARETLAESARQARHADEPRGARYAEVALDGECQRVTDTPAGNRNNVLASASFKVGQLLCEDDDAYERLLDAALTAGLSEREARPTIRSGLRAGCAKPREAA